MKLILVGGVQGVGKSTILNRIRSKFDKEITFVDPGEIFRQNKATGANRSADDVEELILNSILDLPDDAVAVVHWHYAVVRPEGYIPQISFERLKRLAESGKIDKVLMVSVEASTEIIRNRRLKDQSGKKRNLVKQMIDEERRLDLEYLMKHCDLFVGILGESKVSTYYLSNFNQDHVNIELSDLYRVIWE